MNSLALLLISFLLPPQASAAPEWRRMHSEKDRFVVTLPGRPTDESHWVETPYGTLRYYEYVLKHGESVYSVGWIDYSRRRSRDAPGPQILDSAVTGLARKLGGKVETKRPIKWESSKGRDLLIKLRPGIMSRAKLYLVGDRLYQAYVVAPEKQISSADSLRFINGFAPAR